ncbi:flagellar export protein FliJ [Virgibacillus sediminis]|uniref:Flagellar FliJ protein n=1 Tax=Virgibacillus sediminis TaxID=202260 RepID=A0ABV7AB53_9BACI
MAEITTLAKVLHVRENEKLDAQKIYHQAMEQFERSALSLYELLRKKEETEEAYDLSTQQSIPIETLKQQNTYLQRLNLEIDRMQKEVQYARTEMEARQHKLTDAHMEVKKFEKIIENRKQTELEAIRKEESAMMDEISIRQYLSKSKGE